MLPDKLPENAKLEDVCPDSSSGTNRSQGQQALFQLAALAVTLVIAIVGGTITGLVVRADILNPPTDNENELFEDKVHWDPAPADEEEEEEEEEREERNEMDTLAYKFHIQASLSARSESSV